jgi:hypothetical protein
MFELFSERNPEGVAACLSKISNESVAADYPEHIEAAQSIERIKSLC